MALAVRQARLDDLDALAGLFDGYRIFYGKSSDVASARAFLAERLRLGDSVIFVAEAGGGPVGFTQLYPSFSSVGMGRTFILNDLFVGPEGRGSGVGAALVEAASDFARAAGAIRLTLSTQRDNRSAQSLYEKLGWLRDEQFCVYNLQLAD